MLIFIMLLNVFSKEACKLFEIKLCVYEHQKSILSILSFHMQDSVIISNSVSQSCRWKFYRKCKYNWIFVISGSILLWYWRFWFNSYGECTVILRKMSSSLLYVNCPKAPDKIFMNYFCVGEVWEGQQVPKKVQPNWRPCRTHWSKWMRKTTSYRWKTKVSNRTWRNRWRNRSQPIRGLVRYSLYNIGFIIG